MGQAKGKRRKEDNPQNQQEKQPEGPVEGVLRGLGEVIPGFGELVKGLEKSEAFQERLEAANAEIERRMGKAPPSRRAGGTRRSIIPARTNSEGEPNHARERVTGASTPERRDYRYV